MKRWILRTPQDGTLFAGLVAGAVAWTLDPARAVSFPSFHQATLRRIEIERLYGDVGFYSLEVRDAEKAGA